MKKDIANLSEWIENREMRGYYTFTKEDKMQDDEFLGDTKQLLRPDEKFNPQEGYEVVRTLLIDRLQK